MPVQPFATVLRPLKVYSAYIFRIEVSTVNHLRPKSQPMKSHNAIKYPCLSVKPFLPTKQIAGISVCLSVKPFLPTKHIAGISVCLSVKPFLPTKHIAGISVCLSVKPFLPTKHIAGISVCLPVKPFLPTKHIAGIRKLAYKFLLGVSDASKGGLPGCSSPKTPKAEIKKKQIL
jgi:hypothetical protein